MWKRKTNFLPGRTQGTMDWKDSFQLFILLDLNRSCSPWPPPLFGSMERSKQKKIEERRKKKITGRGRQKGKGDILQSNRQALRDGNPEFKHCPTLFPHSSHPSHLSPLSHGIEIPSSAEQAFPLLVHFKTLLLSLHNRNQLETLASTGFICLTRFRHWA